MLATDTQSNSVEDRIIRIDHETGEITDVFDLAEVLGKYKELLTDADAEDLDWMHINTLQWMGEQTVILSSRETSSILKISSIFETPKLEYIIGEKGFWNGTGYEDFLLEKDESDGTFSGTGDSIPLLMKLLQHWKTERIISTCLTIIWDTVSQEIMIGRRLKGLPLQSTWKRFLTIINI